MAQMKAQQPTTYIKRICRRLGTQQLHDKKIDQVKLFLGTRCKKYGEFLDGKMIEVNGKNTIPLAKNIHESER